MQSLSHLSDIANRYDAFILDLWGVIHDGSHLYPGVHAALTKMRAADKRIIMLSNAPRRARKVAAVLGQLGVEPALYNRVISSGEAGFEWLASKENNLGKRYYYIGPQKDLDVADGLGFAQVYGLSDADFLLNVGFGSEEQNDDDYVPLLREAWARQLPMVCLNPDLEVVKISGERFACAGVIAQQYQAMGGRVLWFGKPYPAVYDACMQVFGPIPRDRVLAIGDSLETDIPGAKRFGIDCALVTGGILKRYSPLEITAMCNAPDLKPTYIMPQLAW